jgi:hypothetical protein
VTDVRSLLKRVAALERARNGPRSPIEVWYGGFDAFAAEVKAKVDAGALDRIDLAGVVNALRRWHADPQVWGRNSQSPW